MALLQLLAEEEIADDRLEDYFQVLYRVVCVAERLNESDRPNAAVRSTYIVDWEQLVHLLEDYKLFGEDIVEVAALSTDEAGAMRRIMGGGLTLARA